MPEPEPASISQVGPYRVEKKLGRGGMGTVFRAVHETLERPVALKVLPGELAASPEFITRFLREAKAIAALRHPHVVEVYDAGADGGRYFIAMELVEGGSLHDYLKEKGTLPENEGLRLLREAADGLSAAHEKGLIHRDIKPDNILLKDQTTVRIVDFGLVRDATSNTKITATGAMLGTPNYISPEQAGGENADERSDLYSLGCTFYRVLTGQPVFVSESAMSLIFKHRYEPAPDPRKANPTLSDNAAHLLLWMLSKKASDRPASAKDVCAALDRIAKGEKIEAPAWFRAGAKGKPAAVATPAAATPAKATPAQPGAPARWPLAIAALAALAFAVALWFAFAGAGAKPATPPEAGATAAAKTQAVPSKTDSESAKTDSALTPETGAADEPALTPEQQEEFDEFMKIGAWALKNARYTQARANFILALRLKPGYTPAADGLRAANEALDKAR